MVQIEDYNDNDDGPYGDQYDQPGAGTQDAASALLAFGELRSSERHLTPEQKQIIKQSKKEIQMRLNKNGEYEGASSEEEEAMIDLMIG